jgi:sortase (surface protein transpeptidase)
MVLMVAAVLAVPAGCAGGGDGPRRYPHRDAAPAMARVEPVSVDIPKIGAHSSLVPLGLNPDNTVQVPPVSTPMQAGWYSYGPTPGETGPAVILGHVDGMKQAGIFYRLRELASGDRVSVSRRDGSTARFVVTRVDRVSKDAFPTDAVYGNTAGPELRLITCGGDFDHTAHSYRDNVIVYAGLE